MRMALLAEWIPASEAFEWGLVTAVYPADQLEAEVSSVICTLVTGPAVALRKTKNAINAATLVELEAALEREKQGQLGLIESHDFRGHGRSKSDAQPASPTPDVSAPCAPSGRSPGYQVLTDPWSAEAPNCQTAPQLFRHGEPHVPRRVVAGFRDVRRQLPGVSGEVFTGTDGS
jgi:hypothetical protein